MGTVNSNYVSEYTVWMDQQKANNPQWAEEQKTGRLLWWDKPQDVDTTTRNAASKVKQKPYPYDVNFHGA